MSNRSRQQNMAQTFTANLGLNNFHTALFTNHATMLNALIFTAQALIVLNWAKNFGTKQTIAFRLKGPVVNSLRLLHFTIRPIPDLFRTCQLDSDGIKA